MKHRSTTRNEFEETMDPVKTAVEGTAQHALGKNNRGERRRRSEMTSDNVRYFLPRPGSSSDQPELGQEIGNEGEVLVQAFKSGQVFYTLVAWKAVPEITGNEPRIVKQALNKT
jgi:hypothetical protein